MQYEKLSDLKKTETPKYDSEKRRKSKKINIKRQLCVLERERERERERESDCITLTQSSLDLLA